MATRRTGTPPGTTTRPAGKPASKTTTTTAKKAAGGSSATPNKTRPEAASVDDFIAAVADAGKRADSATLVAMMREATGCEPVMWGPGIIGFDQYHYRYDSGREGDMAMIGFSPRKQAMVLYIMPGFAAYDALLATLGKFTTGSSCLYVKRLSDIDLDVLDQLLRASVADMRARYPRG